MILAKNTDLKISNKTIAFFVIVLAGTDLFNVFLAQYCNKRIIDYLGIESLNLSFALFLVFLFCLFGNFKSLQHFIEKRFVIFKLNKIANKFKEKTFNYTIQHSISYFNNSFSGDISSKISDISKQLKGIVDSLSHIINNFIFFTISFIFFTKVNILIAITLLVSGTIYLVFYKTFCFNEYVSTHKTLAETGSKYFGLINDIFANIINVKAFSKTYLEKHNSNKYIFNIKKAEKNLTKLRIKRQFFNMISSFILFFSVISISTILLSLKKITSGDFVFIIILLHILRFVIESIVRYSNSYYASRATINNSIEKLYQPIEITDKTEKELILTDGKIVFKNVRFGYEKQ